MTKNETLHYLLAPLHFPEPQLVGQWKGSESSVYHRHPLSASSVGNTPMRRLLMTQFWMPMTSSRLCVGDHQVWALEHRAVNVSVCNGDWKAERMWASPCGTRKWQQRRQVGPSHPLFPRTKYHEGNWKHRPRDIAGDNHGRRWTPTWAWGKLIWRKLWKG